MQLLVSQIKNQDPLNPADGTEFVTQLAQFTEMEQMMSMNSGISAISAEVSGIRKDIEPLLAAFEMAQAAYNSTGETNG